MMAFAVWKICNSSCCVFSSRAFSSTSPNMRQKFKFVVAGGGTGGITMASRILGLGQKDVAVIEPSEIHYYQPYWTLVGGALKPFESSFRPMSDVFPKKAHWIKDKVSGFDPKSNIVHTEKSGDIEYEILVVALGLRLAFEKIKGLPEALETPGVCSNYSSLTVMKTVQALRDFREGNAIFTQPPNPIKCGGAPQKIMYLAEDYFTKLCKREAADIQFHTALGVMFSSPTYAAALEKVARGKGITVNYFHNLVEVRPESREALFNVSDAQGNALSQKRVKYELLHVTPPMVSPGFLGELGDGAGFLDVNKHSLQSTHFENVFGIGDCTNLPTSKTAAAVASQCGVLTENIKRKLAGQPLKHDYMGYTSCPLVTGYSKGILAEFNYELTPEETLPVDQSKERHLFYYLKSEVMPFLYWSLMLKGYWTGPKFLRKLFHIGSNA